MGYCLGFILYTGSNFNLFTLCTRCSSLGEKFASFNQWDNGHYIDIIDRGYQLPSVPLTGDDVHSNKANVAYFSAYPLGVQGLKAISGLSTRASTVMTASNFFVFCFGCICSSVVIPSVLFHSADRHPL